MKAFAQKNSDGSYTVWMYESDKKPLAEVVFKSVGNSEFPINRENERLALEYVAFKKAQAISGPDSPATQAVLADAKAMEGNDLHEQLMATLEPSSEAEVEASREAHRIARLSPEDQKVTFSANREKAVHQATMNEWGIKK